MKTGQSFRDYLALREARYASWVDPATGMASRRFTESAACPLCRREACRAWFVKRGFRWVGCQYCGTVYVSPRLSAEARRVAYCGPDAHFYYTHCATSDAGESGWQEELARIHQNRRPGRLLDVACGSGAFLHCARQAGWEVEGVEVNPAAAALAWERYAIRVHMGAFESSAFAEASFDVVTIFQVLDQLPDPLEALWRVRRLLVPGGLLVVTVPNVRSFIIWAIGAHHRHFTPEKGVCFTPRTLRRMVSQAGFARILGLRTFGEECTLSNVLALVRTHRAVDLFEHRASQNGTAGGLNRQPWLRPLGRSLDRLLAALTRRVGLGSYMTVYAQTDAASIRGHGGRA